MTKEHPQIHSLALSERHIFVKIMDEKRRRKNSSPQNRFNKNRWCKSIYEYDDQKGFF